MWACVVLLLLLPGLASAFISKIRATDGTKIPCHQVAASYHGYVLGHVTGPEAKARLEILCGCTLTGQDLTDLNNFQASIDAIGVIDIGSTTGQNNTELAIQQLRKVQHVSTLERYCGLFELNNDALLNEAQLRQGLGIP